MQNSDDWVISTLNVFLLHYFELIISSCCKKGMLNVVLSLILKVATGRFAKNYRVETQMQNLATTYLLNMQKLCKEY